ncbi:hypothetical protein [Acanthopleuribacter pedis]|uniref:Uncharacterized protein n=1 Tax=Acanthopleuribacter pedis TaxID=442870 RepID=A0A8J7QM14_9BACT|nr:hypothetical protein [Acanthopleuribacter pedis]MBO1320455.1 hypothetical protein [Acanthopleuribacter pedis]
MKRFEKTIDTLVEGLETGDVHLNDPGEHRPIVSNKVLGVHWITWPITLGLLLFAGIVYGYDLILPTAHQSQDRQQHVDQPASEPHSPQEEGLTSDVPKHRASENVFSIQFDQRHLEKLRVHPLWDQATAPSDAYLPESPGRTGLNELSKIDLDQLLTKPPSTLNVGEKSILNTTIQIIRYHQNGNEQTMQGKAFWVEKPTGGSVFRVEFSDGERTPQKMD